MIHQRKAVSTVQSSLRPRQGVARFSDSFHLGLKQSKAAFGETQVTSSPTRPLTVAVGTKSGRKFETEDFRELPDVKSWVGLFTPPQSVLDRESVTRPSVERERAEKRPRGVDAKKNPLNRVKAIQTRIQAKRFNPASEAAMQMVARATCRPTRKPNT